MVFQYRPLESGEIRLLRPVSQPGGSLSFQVVHRSLLSKSRYASLSYVWGPPGNTHTVSLDGNPFPIRPDLNDALQQIQSSRLLDRLLWVDAICINQNDTRGKTAQVQLMRQIYERSSKVLVWLGKPENEEDNRLACQKMAFFVERMGDIQAKGRPARRFWWPQKLRTIGHDRADFSSAIFKAKDKNFFDVPGSQTHRAWLGITALWNQRYFSKGWIFQECTIPEQISLYHIRGAKVLPIATKVNFLCGDQSTNWPAINAALGVAAALIADHSIDSTSIENALELCAKLFRFRQRRVVNGITSLPEVLHLFRHAECEDPRDKVYVPLRVAPDDVRQQIRPDYGKSILDVYGEVVRYHLAQSDHKLDFIGNILYREDAQTVRTPEGVTSVLPSWVHNYASRIQLIPTPKILYVTKKQVDLAVALYNRRGRFKARSTVTPAFTPLSGFPAEAVIHDSKFLLSNVYVDAVKEKIPSVEPTIDIIPSTAQDKYFTARVPVKLSTAP